MFRSQGTRSEVGGGLCDEAACLIYFFSSEVYSLPNNVSSVRSAEKLAAARYRRMAAAPQLQQPDAVATPRSPRIAIKGVLHSIQRSFDR
jgi:hypothetical protein